MAYNNGLLNFGDSFVEVGYDNVEYSVDKAQIVEKDGAVHELGGGGGDIWQIAFTPSQYKIEGLQGEYELQDGGHGEYGAMIARNVVPDEVLSGSYFTGEFTINIDGTDYVMTPFYLNDFQMQAVSDYISIVVTMAPSAEDENIIVYIIGIDITSELPVTTITISCPDITIAAPTDDAVSLATLLSPLL